MLQESFRLIFELREIEILKNLPVKIWLPWNVESRGQSPIISNCSFGIFRKSHQVWKRLL